jgi:oligopeptide transport system permease protein
MRTVLLRLLTVVPTLWAIVTITFFIIRLAPGGPFMAEREIPPEARAALDAKYGLDQGLLVQYGRYLGNVARFDLGPSYKFPSRSVREIVLGALPISLELGVSAMLLALALGIAIGTLAALRGTVRIIYGSVISVSVPNFVLRSVLVVFALTVRWLRRPPQAAGDKNCRC